MKALLEGLKAWLKNQYSCLVIIEPLKSDRPDPRWRLAAGNFSGQGNDRRVLNALGTIQADGDGPDAFLSKLLEMSEKSAELELTEKGFEFDYTLHGGTYKAKATFSLYGDGDWRENNEEDQWSFSYMETYRIQISYNPNNN